MTTDTLTYASPGPHRGNHGLLVRLMWLAVATAVATIALKTVAWALTGSVGLLSDAAESVVNLVAAVVGLLAVKWASQPADEDHAYGHDKANYLSAGAEGAMIVIAALYILVSGIARLFDPQPIDDAALGLAVSGTASVLNLVVGTVLIRVGRRERSLVLEADGRHLMTDVWTSIGVIVGVAAVAISGWEELDAIIAIVVALNIIGTGVRLIRRSTDGLMDRALAPDELAAVNAVLDRFANEEVGFHALRTRQSGPRRFISVHVLVPGDWTVQRGHDYLEAVEEALRTEFSPATIFTHLEPIEDPVSFEDALLDRD
ncbi:MAG: cation diffusion facilitator family transporter [Patulibacter minatonensis]